jgi:hypothetical protein
VIAVSTKQHQPATAELVRTDAPATTTGGAGGNAATEEAAARARLRLNLQWVPPAWIELGKDLFRDVPTVDQVPDEAAFRAGAYKLIADQHHNVAPMLEVLASSPDRKPFLEALQAVDAAGKADAPHVRAIEGDVKDLAAGGDINYNTRDLLAHYAPLSALGKGWIAAAPIVGQTFATYVNGGECHRHGVLAKSYFAVGTVMEHAVVQNAQREGDARVEAARRLMLLLTKGSLGVGPVTETPVVEGGAPKEAAADAAKQEELAALDAEAEKLETRIRAAVKAGKKHDGVRTVDDKTFAQLKADLEAADPRVRDRIYADGELMHHLTQAADARQVQELVHAVDTVEALYQACLQVPPPPQQGGVRYHHTTKKPFELVRDYLLERTAPEQKDARMRVLRHEQLKSYAIDPMVDEDRRLIFRLITRGTLTPTAEDRVQEAATAGDGAAMARALMQLASEDPGQLAALKQDQLFWQAVEKLDKDIVVDGMTVNPFSLCLTMWGIEPRSVKDPGAEELHGTVNLTGDNRPLTIEERIKLDEELFGPTIRSLYSEFCETIVDDADCVSILRRFEEKALQKEYSDLLHRAKEAPGPTLQDKYNAHHSPLRNELQEYTEGNERLECERIIGIRLEATVGTIGGLARLSGDKTQGPMQLEQAVRETAHDGKPLTQWVSRCVDTFLEETYVPPEYSGYMLGGGPGPFGDLEEVLDAWNKWSAIFEQHKGEVAQLSGMPTSSLHAIELLSNAFRMRAGELGDRMNRCFRGKERDQVLAAMSLRPQDVQQRQMAGNTELMKTDPAAAIAQQADMLWKTPAQEIFEAIGTLSVDDEEEIDALATRITAATARGIEPPADEAAAAQYATVPEDQQPRSFSAYYRKHNGIDYKLHIARVISASPGHWALGGVAAKLGVDSALLGAAAAPPDTELVIDERNQHLVRPDFTVGHAEALGKQIWEVLHGSGEVHLIMSQLYGKYTPEEQRLISVAFQRLSGGIDVAFYIRQEMLARKEGSDVTQIGGEGTAAGTAAVGGKTELNVEGDQTKLETALMVATTGELDNVARFRAAVANRDMNQLFRVCDDCSDAECRRILGDSALMDAAYKSCDQYAWDRVSKTLTGQSDLMDRLYSRAHGAYDSWNPFDCTDEAGIREDIKSYVQRLRRKFDQELRASGKGTDPKKLQKDIEDKVREACQRLMANPNVRGLIEAELSGSELGEVEGLILNAGEDSTKSEVARDGEEASTIIAGIRALSPAQKAPLRSDPAYLEKLALRLTKPEDYREAMDLLMSDQSGQGGLADLDKAVNPHGDEDRDIRSAKKSLLALSEAEYRALAADPALQARILASIEDPKERTMVREMLALRLPEIGADLSAADKAAAADASRLAYLKHSAVQRIQFATTLGWDTMLAQCVEVFQMDFAPAPVQAKPGDTEPPPDPSAQLAAAKAAGEKTRREVWATVEDDVVSFSGRTVKDTRRTMSTISDAGAMTKMIRAAVLGLRDPSAERLKENLVGEQQIVLGGETHTVRDASDNDQKGLLATLNAASPDLLIAEWTSVTQERPDGGESMQATFARFVATEDALSAKIDAAQTGPQNEQTGKVESPITPAERQAYQKDRLAFMNYVPGISAGLEGLLVPYVGDENDRTAKGDDAQKREDLRTRDNKKYNELLDAIGSRAQALPRSHTAKVATAIGATKKPHVDLVDNQNRETLGQLELREQKYLQQRGTQAGSGWAASDEAEALDQAMVRYAREAAMVQVTQDGQQDAYGMITAAEGAKVEEKGAEFDRAHQAFKDAKAKVAMWMSLIIGVLVTCILTVLTGGAATGFAAMLFWSAVTAGASAAAKAAINEAVLGSDYDFSDEGVKMIGKEMLTAVITAGTTFVAQKMVAGVAGMTTLSRQARAAEQTMRVKPPLWKSFLDEGSEEILSETMSGTIEAGLIAIDPTHWMHGVVEGQDRALPEAWAKLSSVPGGALRGGITSIVTAGATKVLGGKKGQLQQIAKANKGKTINLRENFATVFGDQREAMIATFTEFAIAKIGGERFDIENVPGELLEGYLQEMSEKSVEMHTGTAHKAGRGERARADAKKYEQLLTKQEQADFVRMNEEAAGTDTYISPADYVGVRHQMATDALGAWSERTGQQLTPAQAQGFVMFVRGARDADELQTRLQMDPRLAATAQAIDAQGFDPSKRIMFVPDQGPVANDQQVAPAAQQQQTQQTQQTQTVAAGQTGMTVLTPSKTLQVVGEPASLAEGHDLMRRLAAGDPSALAQFGMAASVATDEMEWGLGQMPDGRVLLVSGEAGAVDFDQVPGLKALAHTHPRVLDGEQRDLTSAKSGGVDAAHLIEKGPFADKVAFLPSYGDLAYFAENGITEHVVYTPYVHLGGGQIGNPDPAQPNTQRVEILVTNARLAGRSAIHPWVPAYTADVIVRAPDGSILWYGQMYQNHFHIGNNKADSPSLNGGDIEHGVLPEMPPAHLGVAPWPGLTKQTTAGTTGDPTAQTSTQTQTSSPNAVTQQMPAVSLQATQIADQAIAAVTGDVPVAAATAVTQQMAAVAPPSLEAPTTSDPAAITQEMPAVVVPDAWLAEQVTQIIDGAADNAATQLDVIAASSEEIAAIWHDHQVDVAAFMVKYASHFETAKENIKKARASAMGAYYQGIPDEELLAIIMYTGAFHKYWNAALRTGDTAKVGEYAAAIKLATEGLAKLPDYDGWSYRGVGGLDAAALARYVPGQVTTEPFMTSSSHAKNAAFGGSVQFQIRSRHGKVVEDISRFKSETEVLYAPNTKFLVHSKTEVNGVTTIVMEEVESGEMSTGVPTQEMDASSAITDKVAAMQAQAPVSPWGEPPPMLDPGYGPPPMPDYASATTSPSTATTQQMPAITDAQIQAWQQPQEPPLIPADWDQQPPPMIPDDWYQQPPQQAVPPPMIPASWNQPTQQFPVPPPMIPGDWDQPTQQVPAPPPMIPGDWQHQQPAPPPMIPADWNQQPPPMIPADWNQQPPPLIPEDWYQQPPQQQVPPPLVTADMYHPNQQIPEDWQTQPWNPPGTPALQHPYEDEAAALAISAVAPEATPQEALEGVELVQHLTDDELAAFKEALGDKYAGYMNKVRMLRSHIIFADLVAGMTDDQIIAVIGYTGSDYSMLNRALRSKDPGELQRLGPYIQSADRGLAALPNYEGRVYRGAELPPHIIAKYEPGQTVTEEAFTSTSYETKSKFDGNVVFEIVSRTGKQVEFLSEFSHEKEVLFRPGTKLLVTEKYVDVADDGTKTYRIFCEEVVG